MPAIVTAKSNEWVKICIAAILIYIARIGVKILLSIAGRKTIAPRSFI